MNWFFVFDIAFGIAIGIIVSVALLELTCYIVDTVKNKKKEKSEDLLNPDNVTFTIEKDKLTKAEVKMLENGYIAKLPLIGIPQAPHLTYIRFYKKEETDNLITVRRSDLRFYWLIDFEPHSKRVCINFDISVELLEAVVERCRELGWISNGNEKAEKDTWF